MEQEKQKTEKIGFLETYNKEAGKIEKSSDRLKSRIALIMAFLIVIGQLYFNGSFDSWGFFGVIVLFLTYSAAPKTFKEMAAIKNFTATLKK